MDRIGQTKLQHVLVCLVFFTNNLNRPKMLGVCRVCANTQTKSTIPLDNDALLRVATRNDHRFCVEAILIEGADVNNISTDGNTPLTRAVQSGSESIVHLLIQAGADVNGTDVMRCTALTKAVHRCSHNLIDMLLNEGADVNKVNKYCTSPLMLACRGCITCVNVLLDAGADVNVVTKSGYTALIHTSASVDVNIVRTILKAGSVVNQFNQSGKNAITFLVERFGNGMKELVWTLYVAGEIVNTFHTPLPYHLKKAESDARVSLKGLCRKTIRNHLTHPNPHLNLFVLVPKLGLPAPLAKYVVYYVSLTSVE